MYDKSQSNSSNKSRNVNSFSNELDIKGSTYRDLKENGLIDSRGNTNRSEILQHD